MKRLVKLSCNCFINPDDISEVTISAYGYITVRMKSGVGHHVDNNHRQDAYHTVDQLNLEIAAALSAPADAGKGG